VNGNFAEKVLEMCHEVVRLRPFFIGRVKRRMPYGGQRRDIIDARLTN
jgi:hypothetical protein